MQTTEIIAKYQTEIATLDMAIGSANNCRTALEALERQLDAAEAEVIVAGVEGSNAEQRKANLTLSLERLADYQRIRTKQDEMRRGVATAERQASVARETCRLLRLQLALAVPDGVRELAAA